MAKRKSKKPQEEDTSILLEPSVSPPSRKKTTSSTSPTLWFIVVFTVGVSVMGWFCVEQQNGLDQLSESLAATQKRITNLQQMTQMTSTRADSGLAVEERIFALEEAQKQAQEKAEVALATSENLKNSDLSSQLWDLRDEIDAQITEMKQVFLSVTSLQAMFKNQSEEFEAVKASVAGDLRSSSALVENVAVLTNAVAGARSRVDEQVASTEALNAQLEGQASELNELKELMHLHHVALHTNDQEMAAIKELAEAKQAMLAHVLEEMLSSVQMTLDEQFLTSQHLRSSVMAQLQTFHSQLEKAAWSVKAESKEEGPAAEEVISTTTPEDTEVQETLEDVAEKDEQHASVDEAEEEEEEEEAMQEEQPLEQEVEAGIIEEREEEDIAEEEEEAVTPEEQDDEEITEQSEEEEEEEEVAGDSGEEEVEEEVDEEVDEETLDDHDYDESLEEEISEDVEESAELDREVFMDQPQEDR